MITTAVQILVMWVMLVASALMTAAGSLLMAALSLITPVGPVESAVFLGLGP